jgi:hypothetical protein
MIEREEEMYVIIITELVYLNAGYNVYGRIINNRI